MGRLAYKVPKAIREFPTRRRYPVSFCRKGAPAAQGQRRPRPPNFEISVRTSSFPASTFMHHCLIFYRFNFFPPANLAARLPVTPFFTDCSIVLARASLFYLLLFSFFGRTFVHRNRMENTKVPSVEISI